MRDRTIMQYLEKALDYALEAEAHRKACTACFRRRRRSILPTPAAQLAATAHQIAERWHIEAADNAWACVQYAQPDPMPAPDCAAA